MTQPSTREAHACYTHPARSSSHPSAGSSASTSLLHCTSLVYPKIYHKSAAHRCLLHWTQRNWATNYRLSHQATVRLQQRTQRWCMLWCHPGSSNATHHVQGTQLTPRFAYAANQSSNASSLEWSRVRDLLLWILTLLVRLRTWIVKLQRIRPYCLRPSTSPRASTRWVLPGSWRVLASHAPYHRLLRRTPLRMSTVSVHPVWLPTRLACLDYTSCLDGDQVWVAAKPLLNQAGQLTWATVQWLLLECRAFGL